MLKTVEERSEALTSGEQFAVSLPCGEDVVLGIEGAPAPLSPFRADRVQ
jgi:hypothetical protein